MTLKQRIIALGPDWRTLASGVAIIFAFPPWDLSWLIWFVLVPWLMAVKRAASWRGALRQGYWMCFCMTIGGFYWVAYVLNEFAAVPWVLCGLFLIAFASFNEIQFIILAPLLRVLLRNCSSAGAPWRILAVILATALFYTGADWLFPKLFADTLGHAFYINRNIRQAADIGGANLLTLGAILSNLAIWQLIDRMTGRREPSIWPALHRSVLPLVAAGALAAAFVIYGTERNKTVSAAVANARQKINLGVVQANIGDLEKMAAEQGLRDAAFQVVRKYIELSDIALKSAPRPDAIIWPETAFPSTFRTPENTYELARDQLVEQFVRTSGVPLLFGGYDQRDGLDYNTLFFLDPSPRMGGYDLQLHHKSKLLMFGEYIPGVKMFPFLQKLFPQVANFGSGPGPEVLKIPHPLHDKNREPVPVGPIICYEALFPWFILEAARSGSRMILNVTNDSWFGYYGEPELHLALTTFRGIEARLPQIRSTNTGITALIMPDGEIVKRTQKHKVEVLNVTVPLNDPIPTLMLRLGDWFGPAALAAALVAFGMLFLPERARRSRRA